MGQRLSELRRLAGLTQEGLARRADVTTGAVRNWEKGKRTPSFEMAVKLADALDVTLDELAGRAARRRRRAKGGAPPPTPPEAAAE